MEYNDLLKYNEKYGNNRENIIKHRNYEYILKTVFIAPCWEHEMFLDSNLKMEQINEKIYNFYDSNIEFTFIELKAIGAPVIMDRILSLGFTKCKILYF